MVLSALFRGVSAQGGLVGRSGTGKAWRGSSDAVQCQCWCGFAGGMGGAAGWRW